jgi:predicted HNH restriction endonuclease|tara:strand:+ start:55 stop:321 length:267 start_codon:yes stop_codon:yes gene_type:complete
MNLTTKYRNAKKEKAIEYLGGICWRCEEVYDREVYDFHHLDPNTKEYSWTVLRRYKWETIKKELDKCILLCSNCHRLAHKEMRENAVL